MELSHGGDWAGYEREYSVPLLDFSANVSPLGLPENVRQAVVRALDTADRYPDPLCRALGEAIARAEGVSPDWVLCGNGAADLIWRAALAGRPRRALVTAPAFAEYEAALELAGCGTERFPLRAEDGFAEGRIGDLVHSYFMDFTVNSAYTTADYEGFLADFNS